MFPTGGPPSLPEQPEPAQDAQTVGEALDIDMIREDPALRWRAEQFAAMGMNPPQSRALALDRGVDLHRTRRMIERGCDPDTAFLIVS